MKQALQIAFQREIFLTAIKVCLVVGIILNLINQGDVIVTMQFEKLNAFKVMLTFSVPYLVSTYSATKAKLAMLEQGN